MSEQSIILPSLYLSFTLSPFSYMCKINKIVYDTISLLVI